MPRMLSLIFTSAGLLAGCTPSRAAVSSRPPLADSLPDQRAIRVYASSTVTLRKTGRLWGEVLATYPSSTAGTAFLIRQAGRPCLVTAAHVIAPDPDATLVIDGNPLAMAKDGLPRVEAERVEIRLGELGLSPTAVHLDFAHDLAVLELSADDLTRLGAVAVYQAATGLPHVEDPLTAWGYSSGSALQQSKPVRVNATETSMITVNQPVDPGFSGAPLLDAAHHVVGVLIRTERTAAIATPVNFLADASRQRPLATDGDRWIVR